MKHSHWIACGALPLLMAGCIKSEAPNIEADIIEVRCETEGQLLNVVYHNDGIDLYTDTQVDLSHITFSYTLSQGATIQPDPATVTDYSAERRFVVTSEDGQWHKSYIVKAGSPQLPTRFDFEHWYTPDRQNYRMPYEKYADDKQLNIWACGNAAYSFLVGKGDYTAFPTQPTDNAVSGQYAAKLVTKFTGQPAQPIAAGNLFIGQFDSKQYDPLEATMFGLPFTKKPLRFKGMFSYVPGEEKTFYSEELDKCRMQAILYKTDAGMTHLNGYTVNTSHPNIIARAELPEDYNCDTGGQWREFNIDFKYYADIDYERLEHGGYNLAVIFSASRKGDKYDGAPGSTLCVDNVEIVCE